MIGFAIVGGAIVVASALLVLIGISELGTPPDPRSLRLIGRGSSLLVVGCTLGLAASPPCASLVILQTTACLLSALSVARFSEDRFWDTALRHTPMRRRPRSIC